VKVDWATGFALEGKTLWFYKLLMLPLSEVKQKVALKSHFLSSKCSIYSRFTSSLMAYGIVIFTRVYLAIYSSLHHLRVSTVHLFGFKLLLFNLNFNEFDLNTSLQFSENLRRLYQSSVGCAPSHCVQQMKSVYYTCDITFCHSLSL